MQTPSLNGLTEEQLRALALDAWRRAETEKRRAEAEKQRADLTTAKLAVREVEVKALLARIADLTRQLAEAKQTDAAVQLELELKRVRQQLADATQDLFGTKSERRHKATAKPPATPRKRRGHGPTAQPKLPTNEQVHDLDDADCMCPRCAGELKEMTGQFEESELISVVEVKYELTYHKRQKYRCSGCGHIEAAIGPTPLIAGGRYDISFAVQVALDKYLYHLPLERQVRRMTRRGLAVTSQALWDQLYGMYLLLLPTFLLLHQRVLSAPLLHADETTWRVMGAGARGRSAKWWMWTLTGNMGTLFTILPSRGSAAARQILSDYAGLLVADGYSVYGALEKALTKAGGEQLDLDGEAQPMPDYTLAGCWMHARRPLFKASANSPEAEHALDLIDKLYQIEGRARDAANGDADALLEHRRRLRNDESRAVIQELKLWRDAQRPLPGTKLHKGVTFLTNQWKRLTLFLDEPLVPLDNGTAERELRGPVVGRKNFAGCRTDRGVRVAELLYSLLHTARHEGVDPGEYLSEALIRARSTPGATLLPHEFAAELRESQAISG